MAHVVVEETTPEAHTAVIAASTTWRAFPALWPTLLGEVWDVVRAGAGIRPNRNVMLYKDDVPNVEIGVEVEAPFAAVGPVIPSVLPAGRVARTTHRGGYEDLGAAHAAVMSWCDEAGLERSGVRWEIYGHWKQDSEDQEVEVFYLLR